MASLNIFSSSEETATVAHLHDMDMAAEVLSATIPDLIDVVTYREDKNKHLQLCARQMNSFMRENYTGFIHNVGKNIYPLIIASDYEPGFEGVGSSFTLFLRDGSQHKIAPTVSSDYESYKALSHMSLATFIILTPHLKNPTNVQWMGKLRELKNHILVFQNALQAADKDIELKTQFNTLIGIYVSFFDHCLSTESFTLDQFLEFTDKAFAIIRKNMAKAVEIQANCILPAMLKWKKMLGPKEWSKVYIMIPTVWPVALNSPRLQIFERIIDSDKVHTHIITSEYPRNFIEARDVVGRVVGDRTVGRLVFGTKDTKAKMKVLALSSRTDVVADDFEIALDRLCASLPPEDRALINRIHTGLDNSHNNGIGSTHVNTYSASKPPPGCPMHVPERVATAVMVGAKRDLATSATSDDFIAAHTSLKHMKSSTATPSAGMIRQLVNVRLLNQPGLVDINISASGLIEAITAHDCTLTEHSSTHTVYDASGRTLLPGLVDAHVHLDKAYLLDRCCIQKGDFPEAMSLTLQAKREFTVSDIQARAIRLIEKEIAFGTTLLRTHVEVDPIVGLRALEAILPLKKQYEKYITIQIAVFAQEGITNVDGEIELLRTALKYGGIDAIGSAPYCDTDAHKNIDIIFNLAKEFNLAADFHLDYFLEGKASYLEYVIEQTLKHKMDGKVCLGHMTHLSTLSELDLHKVALQLKKADISVIALPASDICMMARSDTHNVRRGVCPIQKLAQLGVNTFFATNNIQNAFTFTGDGDVMKIGTLLCQMLHMTSTGDASLCLEMTTSRAAYGLGVGNHGIVVGNPADFFLVGSSSSSSSSSTGPSALELLASPPLDRVVFKHGRVVAQSTFVSTLVK